VTPTRIERVQMADGQDLLRAGDYDPDHQSVQQRMSEAAQFGSTWVPMCPCVVGGTNSTEDPSAPGPPAQAPSNAASFFGAARQ
jgi:hypothetical protein